MWHRQILTPKSGRKEKIFFREISDADFEAIRERVRHLFSNNIWLDPDIDIDMQLKINEPVLTRKFLKEKRVGCVLGFRYF